jgi:hypothetical protein
MPTATEAVQPIIHNCEKHSKRKDNNCDACTLPRSFASGDNYLRDNELHPMYTWSTVELHPSIFEELEAIAARDCVTVRTIVKTAVSKWIGENI